MKLKIIFLKIIDVICDNTQSFLEFYILDGGITEKNIEKIKREQKSKCFKSF